MTFFQSFQDFIADGFKGRDDEGCAKLPELGQYVCFFNDMFDLGCEVEGDGWEFVVKGLGHFKGVAGAIQKVGVAESNMSGSGCDLLADVGHDGFEGDDEETAVVNGYDRAVSAGVETAPAGFGVASDGMVALMNIVGVMVEGWEFGAIWFDEGQPNEAGAGFFFGRCDAVEVVIGFVGSQGGGKL